MFIWNIKIFSIWNIQIFFFFGIIKKKIYKWENTQVGHCRDSGMTSVFAVDDVRGSRPLFESSAWRRGHVGAVAVGEQDPLSVILIVHCRRQATHQLDMTNNLFSNLMTGKGSICFNLVKQITFLGAKMLKKARHFHLQKIANWSF